MRAEQCVGRVGRTLTEVAAAGRIEIAGEVFDALTVGPPIPVGEIVAVTGWRLADGSRHVLSVRLVPPDELLPPHVTKPVPPERTTQRSLPAPGRSDDGNGGVEGALLTFGQVVSILTCIATPIFAFLAYFMTAPVSCVWILAGTALTVSYSAAMFVVFSRAKQLPPRH